VTAVTYSGTSATVTLSNVLSGVTTGETVTFSETLTGATTIAGQYGSLVLNPDGSYTYTPNGTGTAGTDTFTYQAQDLSGATSSTATLKINVLASSSFAPSNVTSTITVGQTSVAGTMGNTVIGDSTTSAPLSTNTLPSTISGLYGTLTINSDGTYSYALNNSNATVAALGVGSTLTDSFQVLEQSGSAQAAANLNITINGVAHAPVLKLDPADGATNTVAVFTQGGSAVALASPSGPHVTDVTPGMQYNRLTLSYTEANFADGTAESLIINGATGSNTTLSNLGGLTNGSSGSFTLGGLVYNYSVAVSGGVATITFTPTSAMTVAQADALLAAFRYNNTSSSPTQGSARVLTFDIYDNSSTPLASNLATSTLTVYNNSPLSVIAGTNAVTKDSASTTSGNIITAPLGMTTVQGQSVPIASDVGSNMVVLGVEAGAAYNASASSVVGGSTSASGGTFVAGTYGTLTIGADGSYSYVLNNENLTIEALSAGQTLTETFSIKIVDGSNNAATTTLNVTINGANDVVPTPTLTLNADTDPGPNDSFTNATPTVRVTLNGTGSEPLAGDTVKIYLGGSTLVGSATLTSTNISNGYVDITTSNLGADGAKSLTAVVADTGSTATATSSALALTVDTTAPVLTSAAVNGSTLVLSYTESGSGMYGVAPSLSDFTVKDGGATVSVSAVSIDATAKTVTLTLSSPVKNGDTVTVSYANTGAHNTEDMTGNLAAAFSNHSVTNNTPPPPSETVLINTMTLDSGVSSTDFITNDGSAGRTVTGSISATLGANEVVQVSFDGGNTWTQASTTGTSWTVTDNGTHTGNWTLEAQVLNTVTGLTSSAATRNVVFDNTAPLLASATVTGSMLVLTYTEAGSGLYGMAPDAADFTVTDGVSPVTVNNVTVDTTAKTVTLTLASPVQYGDTVSLTYAPTGSHNTEDIAGNLAASLNAVAVNNTTLSPSAPTETVTIVSMTKDSGTSATDFITDDGSANRTVTLSTSAVTGANEVVQVSFNGGAHWSTATVDGSNPQRWTVSDTTAYTADWSIQARVFNTSANVAGAVATQNVTLVPAPGTPVISLVTDTTDGVGSDGADRNSSNPALTISSPGAGITQTVSLDGGAAAASYTAPTADGSHTVVVTNTNAAGDALSTTYSYVLDTTAPLLSGAAINGNSLVLSYTESGAGLSTVAPALSAFAVSVNGGATVAPTAVAIDTANKTVTLTLSQPVNHGDTVSVNYTPAGTGTQDIAGNLAVAFSGHGVTNNTPAPPSETITITQMTKDSGSSATDFITNDGSANRTVSAPSVRRWAPTITDCP